MYIYFSIPYSGNIIYVLTNACYEQKTRKSIKHDQMNLPKKSNQVSCFLPWQPENVKIGYSSLRFVKLPTKKRMQKLTENNL